MPGSASFFQECPICGRSLQVRVELLGRFIGCPHCRGEFVASDNCELTSQTPPILNRVNELLGPDGADDPYWQAGAASR